MRGAIRDKERYEQAKMLDHTAWDGKLPRKITPSDIDMMFDSCSEDYGAAQLYCELSNGKRTWFDIDYGQHLAYRNIVSTGRCLYVLLTHAVPRGQLINTLVDIRTFHVMGQDCGRPVYSEVYEGCRWERFVLEWFRDSPEMCVAIAKSGELCDIKGNGFSRQAG